MLTAADASRLLCQFPFMIASLENIQILRLNAGRYLTASVSGVNLAVYLVRQPHE
jgi:hypothetical protein